MAASPGPITIEVNVDESDPQTEDDIPGDSNSFAASFPSGYTHVRPEDNHTAECNGYNNIITSSNGQLVAHETTSLDEEPRANVDSTTNESLHDNQYRERHTDKEPNAGDIDPMGDAAVTSSSPSFFRSLNTRQVLTLVTLCFGNISANMFYSLLAPFFPTEALSKGATEVEVALVFGSFQFIVFCLAPFFGYYMTSLGPKFLFVAGNFVCSGCAILFGMLHWCPDGRLYVIMCFVIRDVEAVASAAQNTATFAIGAHMFPNHISTVMGVLQACGAVGLMAGPPIGGLLYTAGGFYLPFVVSGSLFMLFSIASFFVLPSPKESPRRATGGGLSTKWKILRIPVVPLVGFMVFVGEAVIGYVDVALAKHIQDIHHKKLSAAYVGLIFLLPALIVVITAPIYGHIVDRHKRLGRPLIIFGALIGCIGFMGVGPAPFLTFLPQSSLKMVIISLGVSGLGWGTMVLAYQEYVTAARESGYPDNMETQGIISGVNASFNSLGALFGPIVGGLLLDQLGFPWSSTIFAGLIGLAGINIVVYVLCKALCCRAPRDREMSSPGERDPLLSRTAA